MWILLSPREHDALRFNVDTEDEDLDDLAGFYSLAAVFDVAGGELGDMNMAVLMDAHIDKCVKFGEVGDRAFARHLGDEIGELLDALVECGRDEPVAGGAGGFAELFENVVECESPYAERAMSTARLAGPVCDDLCNADATLAICSTTA